MGKVKNRSRNRIMEILSVKDIQGILLRIMKELQFGHLSVPVPYEIERHPISLYGTTNMQLPPVGKRERHFVVSFKM